MTSQQPTTTMGIRSRRFELHTGGLHRMKHDFANSTDQAANERFRAWLEAETIDGLKRTYGDAEDTKTTIFLFVNRAYEAHMPEELIGKTFGKCIVRAGYREEDEGAAFDWLEFLGDIARRVHAQPNR